MKVINILLPLVGFTLVTPQPIVSLIPKSHVNKTLTATADSELVPVKQEFNSQEELVGSPFWKNLQKRKIPSIARSTAIYIKDTQSTYYFKSSEWENVNSQSVDEEEVDDEDVNDDDVELAKLPKFRKPGKGSNKRDIDLVEVQYGKSEEKSILDVPISHCVSSVFSSGGGSYSQSYTWKQGLSLSITPKLSALVAAVGVTVSGSFDSLSLGFSSTGSISCNAPPGGKVQVFSSIKYLFFPLARKRDVVFRSGDHDFDTGRWSKVTGGKGNSEYNKFGAVFFDLSVIPHHQCVTKPEYLSCSDYSNVLDMNNKNGDPRKGLGFQ